MTTDPKPLNKVEVWVAERAVPIFAVIAVLILIGAAAVFYTYEQQGETAHEVQVLRPRVAHIVKCNQRSLLDDKRAEECAARIRIGLINCRRSSRCREALLAAIAEPSTQLGATSSPSTRSPSSPSSSPGSDDTGAAKTSPSPAPNVAAGSPSPSRPPRAPHEGTHEPSPAPSPAAPGPVTPEPSSPAETPASGPPTAPTAPSTSGAGVELCLVSCLSIEIEPKELLP